MNIVRTSGKVIFVAFFLVTYCFKINAKIKGFVEDIDTSYEFSGTFRPEIFYGKNLSLLNDANHFDRIIFWRHMIDLSLAVNHGQKTYEHDALRLFGTIRNRGIWGNPNSISSTTASSVKLSQTVFGTHSHAVPRHILWVRELWIEADLGDLLRLHIPTKQTFTLGAFKFELGRGISLGSAYATAPEILGFYSDDAIDQFAFGGKLSGVILDKKLNYDLYSALLRNKSSSTSDTAEHIYGQQYGRLNSPERGYGIITFCVAGRLLWTPINEEKTRKLTIEPYWLYVNDPEQRVEFWGGARSVLGTLGLAAEYEGEKFAFGFDYAINLGFQEVRGWDRNSVRVTNKDSNLCEINSHVIYKKKLDADKKDDKEMPYMRGDAQKIIDNTTRTAAENGKFIGQADILLPGSTSKQTVYMYNAKNRFRDPYNNKFEGWMFVADGALKMADDSFQIAATAGYASGDEDPNTGNPDGVYSGFVSVQEFYWGKRVKSAFVMGSAGKLKRPLSLPASRRTGRYASTATRFTNLRFVGLGINKKKKWPQDRSFSLNPNALFFWQDQPSPCFDLKSGRDLNGDADQFLGTELNIFLDYFAMKNLKLYFVLSVFLPGGHFSDIRGKPITDAQVTLLDRLDRSGYNEEAIPNIGTNVASTYNIGLEYTF